MICSLIAAHARKLLASPIVVIVFYYVTPFLPKRKISNKEPYVFLLKIYQVVINALRPAVNNLSYAKRDALANRYLIPIANRLFDKNYVNYAQYTLFALEEYFLSKKTEKEFEEVLATFSAYAVAAGERFRKQFPLPVKPADPNGTLTISFVAPFVAVSGYEVVLGLGKSLSAFKPKMCAMRAFDTPTGPTNEQTFAENGITLRLSHNKKIYDVFKLRALMIKEPVDIALWPLPPFHMFFLYSFGLAEKQVWFSNYLRSDISFKYLDEVLTPGGAGTIARKMYNGKEWAILPQVSYIHGITNKNKKQDDSVKYLFTPARLEKLKQPEFMDCVAQIMKADTSTHFKWTGYHRDKEVVDFFKNHGLEDRHTYLPWLDNFALISEIKSSHTILSCFPLSLGTVETMATHYKIPVVAMYDDECNLYWRDIYWEAINGNPVLKDICLDEQGNSKIRIARTPDEYVQVALAVIQDDALAKTYADIYHQSYDYTYLNNPNEVSVLFKNFVDGLYQKSGA